ncbi:cytochrome P450 85A1-like protein [Tanacetum coccineum]
MGLVKRLVEVEGGVYPGFNGVYGIKSPANTPKGESLGCLVATNVVGSCLNCHFNKAVTFIFFRVASLPIVVADLLARSAGNDNVRMLGELIDERRNSKERHEDMLSLLMSGVDNRDKLSDEEIIDQIMTICGGFFIGKNGEKEDFGNMEIKLRWGWV